MAEKIAEAIFKDGTLYCAGNWSVAGLAMLLQSAWQSAIAFGQDFVIDGHRIEKLDSAGALLIVNLIADNHAQGGNCKRLGFAAQQEELIEFIANQNLTEPTQDAPLTLIQTFGRETLTKLKEAKDFFDLTGRVAYSLFKIVKQPRGFHWLSIVRTMELSGIQALPIAGLLAFLIGVVLAYQLGAQLTSYGANIFVVYLSGVSIFREFGPLITAIIVAGRTSSAFTAELGMMKVNQEVDAMLTMGLSPIDWLVLPRIIGLFIVFPLLIFWADVAGVLGSMFMSKSVFGISYANFLVEFKNSISVETFWIGLSKAPVFALIIATVGCYQGFEVASSAESVGQRTTQSVVQAIFLIIIADAVFSVIYSMLGI